MDLLGIKLGLLEAYKNKMSKNFQQKTLQHRKDDFLNIRRQTRSNLMFQKRNIDENLLSPFNTPKPEAPSTVNSTKEKAKVRTKSPNPTQSNKRLEMLAKWKAEKEKKKHEMDQKKKPIFKVCQVQHPIGLTDLPIKKPVASKTKKAEFAPPNHSFRPPSKVQPISLKKVPISLKNTEASGAIPKKKLEYGKSTIDKNPTKTTKANKNDSTKTEKLNNKNKAISSSNVTKIEPTGSEGTKISKTTKKADSTFYTPMQTRGRQKKLQVVLKTPTESPTKNKTPTKLGTKRKNTPYKVKGWIVDCVENSLEKEKTEKCEASFSDVESSSPDYPIEGCNFSDVGTPNHQTPLKDDCNAPVAYVSPFVTVSRGKHNARREYEARNSILPTESPTFNLKNISQNTSPKAGADYFSGILQREINRIEDLCDEWQNYKDKSSPEESHDMIDVAIGQSRLLISKKFEQFRGLINQCRNCVYEEKPVTCVDLHGFWDMIYMQVEDLNKRFDKLKELKDNNWEEVMPEKKPAVPVKQKRTRRAKTKATSSLKDLIKTARERKNAYQENQEEKTFDGGYFSVRSPINIMPKLEKTPAKNTRQSMRVSVLATEAHKRLSSPGVMMRLSQAIKAGDGLTPAKSILKAEGTKSAKKSVLFKEDLPIHKERKSLINVKSKLFSDERENLLNDENNLNSSNLISFSPVTPTRKSARLNKSKI